MQIPVQAVTIVTIPYYSEGVTTTAERFKENVQYLCCLHAAVQ